MLKDLDAKFSVLVRARAVWRCEACGRDFSTNRSELHCSHFWSRWNHSTRFDTENCDSLCFSCHDYYGRHRNEFKAWKLDRMGQEKYDSLERRARQVHKVNRFEVATMIAEGMDALR